jgi:periplasmic protein TonB
MPVGFGRPACYIKAVIDSPRIEEPEAATAAGRDRAAVPRRPMRWFAIAAAALLHLSPALLLVLLYWPQTPPPAPPPAIPVKLVVAPPPSPPPPPPAKPAPPPAPASPAPRRSGPDLTTTAPTRGDAAAPHDDSEPAPASPAPPGLTPPHGTGQPETAVLDPGAASPGPAKSPTAPVKAPPARKRAEPPRLAAIGERETNGDPYLNLVVENIRRHLSYPEIVRPLGLKGIAVYYIQIDRSGRLMWLDLVRSTGQKMLDAAAEKSIREASPFPPPPPEIMGQTLRLDLPMIP